MKIKEIILSAFIASVVSALIFIGFGLVNEQSAEFGGETRFPNSDLSAKSLTADSGGVTVTAGGLTVGSSGTSIAQYRCDTSTWNPASVSSSTAPDSLDISNTGASLGDAVVASFDSATSTSQWNVQGKVTGSGTSTIYLEGISGAAVNLSTSTAKVCSVQ